MHCDLLLLLSGSAGARRTSAVRCCCLLPFHVAHFAVSLLPADTCHEYPAINKLVEGGSGTNKMKLKEYSQCAGKKRMTPTPKIISIGLVADAPAGLKAKIDAVYADNSYKNDDDREAACKKLVSDAVSSRPFLVLPRLCVTYWLTCRALARSACATCRTAWNSAWVSPGFGLGSILFVVRDSPRSVCVLFLLPRMRHVQGPRSAQEVSRRSQGRCQGASCSRYCC